MSLGCLVYFNIFILKAQTSIKKQRDTKQVVRGNTIKQSVGDCGNGYLTSVKDKTTTISTKTMHVYSLFSICKSNFQVIIKLEITVQVGLRLETLRKL